MALQPRGYQLECLQKIKESNTIISLPTGPAPEDLTTCEVLGSSKGAKLFFFRSYFFQYTLEH